MTEENIDDNLILKLINGALRDTINNHGPITKEFISSASKRILGNFKNHAIITLVKSEPEDEEPA